MTEHVSTVAVPSLGDALELMRRLWRVSHEFERLSGRMAASIGITAQQRTTLRIVGRFPKVAPSRLSELLCVDAATISITLGRLEERGLITRRRDASDGRRIAVALTSKGRALDAPAEGTVESAVGRILRRVPERDVMATMKVLDALAHELAHESVPKAPALRPRPRTRST